MDVFVAEISLLKSIWLPQLQWKPLMQIADETVHACSVHFSLAKVASNKTLPEIRLKTVKLSQYTRLHSSELIGNNLTTEVSNATGCK